MTTFDDNVQALRQMLPEYEFPEDAFSGKADGSAPTTGLTDGRIWVHSPTGRTQRVVHNTDPVVAALYGVSVRIGLHRVSQEYHVIGRNPTIPNKVPGNPTAVDVSFLKPENIAAGYVYPNPENGGLSVFISPFRYPGGAWSGGSLTLTPTATTGSKAQVLVGVDMLTNTAVQELGDDAPNNGMYILRSTDADVTRVMAENPHVAWRTVVTLANGASNFTDVEFKSIGHWAITEPKHNFAGSGAPTVDDDVDEGYSVGSQWYDGADIYDCTDATAGAAVWSARGVVGSIGDFTDLDDVPSSYSGEAGNYVQVNATEDGLQFAAPASGGAGDYLMYRDEKTQNTDGGGFTSGSWQTRELTVESADPGGYGSLSSNQITLLAGTYRVRISCPAFLVARHQARLQDITNTATLLLGTSAFAEASGAGNNRDVTCSYIDGRITLAGTTVLEVQHQCQTTKTVNGFGIAANFTTEVYTVAEFIRE